MKKDKKDIKTKQIAVRFDYESYEKISEHADYEHRGLGEFVRHATLIYMEYFDKHGRKMDEREIRQSWSD